ncbi:MAG TPA: nucleoside deaminase [Luteibaculaceae bacterium]|nr:nucleoside deaminase [Luteibaculaceae bacterium]
MTSPMETPYTDEFFMRQALAEAKRAFEEDEIPVGAVVVCQNKIIARGYNQTERLNDVTAHAEVIAITAAADYLGAKFLDECKVYVTLEPCVMCGGALMWARPAAVIFGARDDKRGVGVLQTRIFHPRTEVIGGVLAEESAELMREFFKRKR